MSAVMLVRSRSGGLVWFMVFRYVPNDRQAHRCNHCDRA
jgi:hypothetical protein